IIRSDCMPSLIKNQEMQFQIDLDPKGEHKISFQIICEADDNRPRHYSYADASRRAETETKTLSRSVPQVTSSNSRFNDWIRRSSADVQMMTIGNPENNYPYGGVPWFSTVFGRDGIITALEMLWVQPSFAQGVLESLASKQAIEVDPANEAEPG